MNCVCTQTATDPKGLLTEKSTVSHPRVSHRDYELVFFVCVFFIIITTTYPSHYCCVGVDNLVYWQVLKPLLHASGIKHCQLGKETRWGRQAISQGTHCLRKKQSDFSFSWFLQQRCLKVYLYTKYTVEQSWYFCPLGEPLSIVLFCHLCMWKRSSSFVL